VSNQGVAPGQVWLLDEEDFGGRFALLLVTEVGDGIYGPLVGLDLYSGRVISLYQTTMGMLEAQGVARRVS